MGDSNQNDTVVAFDGKVVGKISFYSLSTLFVVEILNEEVKKYDKICIYGR